MVREKSSPPAAQLLRVPCPTLILKTSPFFQACLTVSGISFFTLRNDSDCIFRITASCDNAEYDINEDRMVMNSPLLFFINEWFVDSLVKTHLTMFRWFVAKVTLQTWQEVCYDMENVKIWLISYTQTFANGGRERPKTKSPESRAVSSIWDWFNDRKSEDTYHCSKLFMIHDLLLLQEKSHFNSVFFSWNAKGCERYLVIDQSISFEKLT